MEKKILFFDIDGTLIENRKGISEIPSGAMEMLKKIQSAGNLLMISSGRPKAMLPQVVLDAGFDGFVLANGGYVEVEEKSIYEERMDYDALKKVVDLIKGLDCEYMLETTQNIYLDPQFHVLHDFFFRFGHDIFIHDFDEESVLKETIKLEINVTDSKREQVEKAVGESFDYDIAFDSHGTDNAFEIYSPSLSKAIGIQKVLDYCGVSKEDTYGFGDGTNDIEMIEFCNIGVAMGNAVQSLKDVADIVCKPIEENGLEEVLKMLFPQLA